MDRTSRILEELKQMVEKKELTPELTKKVNELIEGVESSTINLMYYRRFDSIEKYGYDIVDVVIEADRRQQNKRLNA
ncbi:hypothetical protein CVD28_00660 [Bacillus sp. M6-12]|uniref:hypothetical protein n=1 Tax=Bacillus sp. M6-12 TaxID=2054166 RepID=UPI000C77BF8E|nr:hypothetical protein [Bacillus sp. M6-12]PLS18944.1 hypothetical protein CVD28_00660 [Bacillus sp. M6-12]